MRRCNIGLIVSLIVIFGFTVQSVPTDVLADMIIADQLVVTLGGSTIFNDSFNQNTTFNGTPAPAPFPSGSNFSNGNAASYTVGGVITESTASGGQATLNTANGLLVNQPEPFIPQIKLDFATLNTADTTLTKTAIFTSTTVFDLSVPSTVLGTYDTYLSNRTGLGGTGNAVQLRVRNCVTGIGLCDGFTGAVLQFVWIDFTNNHITLISEQALTAAQLQNNQIALELSHDSSSSDVITASYAFDWNSTTNTGTFTTLGSTSSVTDVFASAVFVRAGFEAFTPVPEPGTFALLGFGLAFLAAWARRKTT